MTSKLSSKVFATVFFLTTSGIFQSAFGQAAATTAAPAASNPSPGSNTATSGGPVNPVPDARAICLAKPNEQEQRRCFEMLNGGGGCSTLEAEVRSTYRKGAAACSAAKLKIDECVDKAVACGEADGDEVNMGSLMTSVLGATNPELNFGGALMTGGQYRGQCMNDREHRDEKRSIKDDLDKAIKKASDLQEKITRTQEEAEKDKRKIKEALQDMNKAAREEDLEAKSNERRADEEMQTAQIKAQQRARQLQIEILQAQGQLAKIIGERARTLAKYTDAHIHRNCVEMIEKAKADLIKAKAGQKVAGSAISVIRQNSESKRRLKMDYDSCRKEMQIARETTREESAKVEASAEQMVSSKMQELSELQSSLNFASEQAAAAKAERDQSANQVKQERLSKMGLLNEEFATVGAATTQKVTQYNQELMQAQQDKNKASNEMATLGTKAAGRKSPDEANEAMAEYTAAKDACELSKCGNCSVIPAASRSTTTPTRTSTDGQR